MVSDFRGPTGVWTLEAKEKKKRKTTTRPTTAGQKGKRQRGNGMDSSSTTENKNDNSPTTPMQFNNAQPTLTHRALYYLWKKERLQFLVTQNVDGLHRRSGFPRDALAILHGCVFTEKCESCGREYFRDQEVTGISFQRTGPRCTRAGCKGYLRDTLLDWCDHLPEDDWERSQTMCEGADLIITLGTSLRMEPAASLVTLGKQYVVVNLQTTPYDEDAALVIRYKVDELLPLLLQRLGYPDDWEEEYLEPETDRVSESISPEYGSIWWKSPSDGDVDDHHHDMEAK